MGTNSSGIDATAPGPGPARPLIPDTISGRPTAEAADAGTAAGTILRQRLRNHPGAECRVVGMTAPTHNLNPLLRSCYCGCHCRYHASDVSNAGQQIEPGTRQQEGHQLTLTFAA